MHLASDFEVAFTQRKNKVVVVVIIEAAAGMWGNFNAEDFYGAVFQFRMERRIVLHGDTHGSAETGRRCRGFRFDLRRSESNQKANTNQFRQKCKTNWHSFSLEQNLDHEFRPRMILPT